MRGLIQRTIYSVKPLRKLPFLNYAAKSVAGLCFDFFMTEYKTEGMKFEIPRALTTRAMRGRFAVDTYELPERELAKRYLPKDSTVLELGGGIGVLSCVINRQLRYPEQHIVVEANKALIPILGRNCDRNSCHFKLEHCIVTRCENLRFHGHKDLESGQVSMEGEAVPTATVEALESRHGLRFNALILDIEGAEYDFVHENLHLVRNLQFLLIEHHPYLIGPIRTQETRDTLSKCGLRHLDSALTAEIWCRL